MVLVRPGGVTYLSESDEDSENHKKVEKSRLPKSELNTSRTPIKSCNQNLPELRSSERIRRRLSQSFHKPTRKDEMEKIATVNSPPKLLQALKPRRLVNDFMKGTHRYNYDPNETSGESSIDDFIEEDDVDNGTTDDGTDTKSCSSQDISSSEQKPNPVKSKKQVIDSDSEDTDNQMKVKDAKLKVTEEKVEESESDDEKLNISTKSQPVISSSDSDSPDSIRIGRNKRGKRSQNTTKRRRTVESDNANANSTSTPKRSFKQRLDLATQSSNENSDNDESPSEDDLVTSSFQRGDHSSPRVALMQRRRDEIKERFSDLIKTRRRKKT